MKEVFDDGIELALVKRVGGRALETNNLNYGRIFGTVYGMKKCFRFCLIHMFCPI